MAQLQNRKEENNLTAKIITTRKDEKDDTKNLNICENLQMLTSTELIGAISARFIKLLNDS